MLGMSSNQITAFVIVFGFIVAFTWFIDLVKLSMSWKLINTIGGAVISYFIVMDKVQ